jgi:hypothetical protein
MDDTGRAFMAEAYWLAETETPYELWYYVRKWAEDTRGYTFANKGSVKVIGILPAETDVVPTDANRNYPVHSINMHDMKVWCNALTEYYNARNPGTQLIPVYQSGGVPIRDARQTAKLDAAVLVPGATGFRMHTSDEWELAARWQGTAPQNTNCIPVGVYYFTKGNSASGAAKIYTDAAETKLVAAVAGVILPNAVVVPAHGGGPVGQLRPNALGIYDMCGNVHDGTSDIVGYLGAIFRGGCAGNYNNPSTIKEFTMGYIHGITELNSAMWDHSLGNINTGLRVARIAH